MAIERVKRLFIETEYPRKLPDVVNKKDIPDLVKQAIARPSIWFNKRKCTERDLTDILHKALEGWQ